jgi:hypothetical protein
MSEYVGGALIVGYCIFQLAGCFFVGRAIFRMMIARKKEVQQPTQLRKRG